MPATIPPPPRPGEPLQASFGAAVVAALRERTVSAGPGLVARTGPGGTVLSLAAAAARNAGASASVIPARVASFAAGVYTVDLYAKGLENPKTGSAEVAATCANFGEGLEPDTVILVHLASAAVVPLEENEEPPV